MKNKVRNEGYRGQKEIRKIRNAKKIVKRGIKEKYRCKERSNVRVFSYGDSCGNSVGCWSGNGK